jgi:amidase
LQAAVGFPYTRGSPIYKSAMPTEDSLLIARLRRAGVIPIGKTNVPEFGMGSHTYNKVYGTTVNPYDVTKSAGGSSGGAGAALAAGLMPIADGSDLGGSLRNPGNFNNIVGFRPSVGLTPTWPTPFPLLGFSVNGPLARTVADVALLMSVMTGPDPRDPSLLPADPAVFRGALARDFRGVRVAWCPDLGGLPLAPEVRAVLDAQRKTFEQLGCIVEEAVPDFGDADSIFLTIRAFRSAATYGPLLAQYRDLLKPEAIAEVELGQSLTTAAVAQAMVRHGQLLDRMRRFEERYAFTLCAVNQLPPFDAKIDWPKEIAGVQMEHYIAWQKSCYWITATFRPALSVPAGFTPDGLPVGLQIVGRYRDDFGALQLGAAFEEATKVGLRRPPLA